MILRLYKPCNANYSVNARCGSGRARRSHIEMSRGLALVFLFLALCTCVEAQRPNLRDQAASQILEDATADQVVAARAILFLKRLDDDVIVYRSLGDFEESGKLGRVPCETFRRDLNEVGAEVEELLSRLPAGHLQAEIRNALASYRDGAYWWQKIQHSLVVQVSELTGERGLPPNDSVFSASLPYTVAIHWRQANKHLRRAVRAAGLQ